MNKKLFIIVSLILSIVLAGCTSATGASQDEYWVRNVVDGDTIELSNGKIVRYIGIDTPEMRKRILGQWQYAPEPFAQEAKDYNESLVFKKKIRLEFDKRKEDKYGRWLAYVFIDGEMANELLLDAGLATIYFFPENRKYTDRLVKAQEEARAGQKGLWESCLNVSSNEAPDYLENVCSVRGQVVDTHRAKNGVFLNFGRPGVDFTAVIFGGNLIFFEKEGIVPARDYRGKYIEVVGKIREYNGMGEIIVSHPSQIKVLD